MSNNLITITGSKILVVDDKPENIELLTQILESEGFDIAYATNGEQAVQIAALFLPALILLDIMMPGIDGYETCRRLKSLTELKDIPVIFVTGRDNISDVVEAYNVGGVDYVTKPIRHEEIIARVTTHLQLQALIFLRDELISTLRQQNIETEKISKLKDEKLERSEQFNHLGELIGELTHEVATPLGVINTAITTLIEHRKTIINHITDNKLSKKTLDDFLQLAGDSFDIVVSNLHHATHIVNSFKKIVVGEFSQNTTEFEICTYLQDIEHILIPKLKRSKHQLIIDCPSMIVLRTESGALSQVLINLINNALIHAFETEQHGSIKLTAHDDADHVIITVADNGKGIEEGEQRLIFDKYFTTRQGKGGSGLGLYIVKKLVTNNLKGQMSVHSKLGEGSEFSIKLPKDLSSGNNKGIVN